MTTFFNCLFSFSNLGMEAVGCKRFTGQAHLPRYNPEAQAEEGYGPSPTKWPLGTAEDSSVLGIPTVPTKGRVKTA